MSIVSHNYSPNRLVIIDWASLSYHQIHSLSSKKKKSQLMDIDTAELEIAVWRNSMLSSLTHYVRLFNPMDIILTLEGTNVWRNDFVKEWYNERAVVYYDANGYWLQFDNFILRFTKDVSGDIICEKMDPVNDIVNLPKNKKLVKDFPDRLQKMFWKHLPGYKAHRSKNDNWDFVVDKKYWKQYKEDFAVEMSNVFRAHCIGDAEAEGDDIAYIALNHLTEKYDDIILITCDSDWNQMMINPKVSIFNHRYEEFVVCPYPAHYIGVKVLSGDKGDNVNGIALPGKKTQLGDVGATKLFESANWLDKAKVEGWEDQYIRNKKLIDLSYIPPHIQRNICEKLDESEPVLCDYSEFLGMGFNDKLINDVTSMKNLGYFSLITKQYLKENPNMFSKTLSMIGDNVSTEETTVATGRKFGNFEKVFFDPTLLEIL